MKSLSVTTGFEFVIAEHKPPVHRSHATHLLEGPFVSGAVQGNQNIQKHLKHIHMTTMKTLPFNRSPLFQGKKN
jgi:hypothetical protein